MKRMPLILCFFLIAKDSYSQEGSMRNLNFIVMIDGKIPFQGDLGINLDIENANRSDTVTVQYIPGNIALNDANLKEVQQDDVKSAVLLINYVKACSGKMETYRYQIQFRKSWINQSFVILRIYNLDKKENRKIFFPLKGEEYTYEVDVPDGSLMRIRRPGVKSECN
jgi:hypothetical protein